MKQGASVALHVRRTDHMYDNGKLFRSGYYKKAVAYIKTHTTERLQFYLFSDDMDWCRNHPGQLGLDAGDTVYFIDWNRGEYSYVDMQLMTFCQHHVIPVSSFSWWGYYLSDRENKIVCAPKGYWLDVRYHF